jgi:hypothetical protein
VREGGETKQVPLAEATVEQVRAATRRLTNKPDAAT